MTSTVYHFQNSSYEWVNPEFIHITHADGSMILSDVEFHRWTYKHWPELFGGAQRLGDIYDGYNVNLQKSFENIMGLLEKFEQGTLLSEVQPLKLIFTAEKNAYDKDRLKVTCVINDTFQVHREAGSNGSSYLKTNEEYDAIYMMAWRTPMELLCCLYYNTILASWDGSEGVIETDTQSLYQFLQNQLTPTSAVPKTGLWMVDVSPCAYTAFTEEHLYIA